MRGASADSVRALIIAINPRKKAAARDAVAQALPQSQQGERAAQIANKTDDGKLHDPWWLWLGVSFVGVYSGYFGAAAGTACLGDSLTWAKSVRSIRSMR